MEHCNEHSCVVLNCFAIARSFFLGPLDPMKRHSQRVVLLVDSWVFVVSLCFVAEGSTVERLMVMTEETLKSVVLRAGPRALLLSKIKAVSI
jgi:hypothetical protein